MVDHLVLFLLPECCRSYHMNDFDLLSVCSGNPVERAELSHTIGRGDCIFQVRVPSEANGKGQPSIPTPGDPLILEYASAAYAAPSSFAVPTNAGC